METIKKKTLFWDVEAPDAERDEKFIIGRILSFGDIADFRWAKKYYGLAKIKKSVLTNKAMDLKSSSFWRQYFNIDKSCLPRQSTTRQSAFSER